MSRGLGSVQRQVLMELARLHPTELLLWELARNVRGHQEAVRRAVAQLVARGDVLRRKVGRYYLHQYVRCREGCWCPPCSVMGRDFR